MGHLNINSFRNKFELVKDVFFNIIHVFFLSETKLDETFLNFKLKVVNISDWTETVMGEVNA